MFRKKKNKYIEKKVLKERRKNMGNMVKQKEGEEWEIEGIIGDGGNVGMMVEKKFQRGVK